MYQRVPSEEDSIKDKWSYVLQLDNKIKIQSSPRYNIKNESRNKMKNKRDFRVIVQNTGQQTFSLKGWIVDIFGFHAKQSLLQLPNSAFVE